MMKMRIAAVLAAVMIGTAALPAVTVFAQGNDPEQTTAAETAAAPETTAVTEIAEPDAKNDLSLRLPARKKRRNPLT